MREACLFFTREQKNFINKGLEGNNILVDACIGSGKTTAIQELCNRFPENKHILYLTYNKLLKADAREKIIQSNVDVHNYHSFAWSALKQKGVRAGINDLIQAFLFIKPDIPHYDVIILDEYQDINQEIADELIYIKSYCGSPQIIAVGDLCQKYMISPHLTILTVSFAIF